MHNAIPCIKQAPDILDRSCSFGRIARLSVNLGLLLGAFAATPTLAQGQDAPITIYFNERPPYQVQASDGSVSGLTATPVAKALRAAGISFVWSKVPISRQMMMLRQGKEYACGIGWFKNPEREQFAKFTSAIYRDLPTVALVNSRINIKSGTSLENVLSNPDIRVLVKDNFSYGAYIDGLLVRLKPKIIRTTNESNTMLEMIGLERADMTFAAEEEAQVLIEEMGERSVKYHIIHFPDVPDGERRYLMCTKLISDATIEKFNKALATIAPSS